MIQTPNGVARSRARRLALLGGVYAISAAVALCLGAGGCTIVHVHVPAGADRVAVSPDGTIVVNGEPKAEPTKEPVKVKAPAPKLSVVASPAAMRRPPGPSLARADAPPSGVHDFVAQESGVAEARWPNGKVRFRGAYSHGRMDGEWKSWDENGNLICERRFRDGLVDGTMTTYHPDGSVAEVSLFGNGRDIGPTQGWYAGGGREFFMPYVNGKREGEATWYHRSGAVRATGFYVDDRLHGEYREFDQAGAVTLRETWNHGTLTKRSDR